MPTARAPMHPTEVAQPFHHEGWVYEEKVDGYRVLAYKDGEHVSLISRHAKDLTARFPELAAAIANLRPETLVLDGEVAAYDEQLVSRFEWMRRPPRDQVATPPMLIKYTGAVSRFNGGEQRCFRGLPTSSNDTPFFTGPRWRCGNIFHPGWQAFCASSSPRVGPLGPSR